MKIVNKDGVFKLGLSTKTSGGRAKMKWFKVTAESVKACGFDLADGESAHTNAPIKLRVVEETIMVGGLENAEGGWIVEPTPKTVEVYAMEMSE